MSRGVKALLKEYLDKFSMCKVYVFGKTAKVFAFHSKSPIPNKINFDKVHNLCDRVNVTVMWIQKFKLLRIYKKNTHTFHKFVKSRVNKAK